MPPTIRRLMEAGVHFGHQTKRWNPKMRPFIFRELQGIHIIDLNKTVTALEDACHFLRKASSEKKNIVFLGSKMHASEIVQEEARRCGSFFISRRWLGGTLTNFESIRLRIVRLNELTELMENAGPSRHSKKEIVALEKERHKLEKALGGLAHMRGRPEILIVVGPNRERIAVSEATKTNVVVVSIVDTDCDPTGIDYPIPGNDDSIKSIKLLINTLADAILNDDDDPDFYHSSGVPRRTKPGDDGSELTLELRVRRDDDA